MSAYMDNSLNIISTGPVETQAEEHTEKLTWKVALNCEIAAILKRNILEQIISFMLVTIRKYTTNVIKITLYLILSNAQIMQV